MKMVWETVCICVLLFLILIVILVDADCKRREAAAIVEALTEKKTTKFGSKAYWAPLREAAKFRNKQPSKYEYGNVWKNYM
jgi:hypothetical protein